MAAKINNVRASTRARHVRTREVATVLPPHPRHDGHDNTDHAQHRHYSGRDEPACPENPWNKLPGQNRRGQQAKTEAKFMMLGEYHTGDYQHYSGDRPRDDRDNAPRFDISHDPARNGQGTEYEKVNLCRFEHRLRDW